MKTENETSSTDSKNGKFYLRFHPFVVGDKPAEISAEPYEGLPILKRIPTTKERHQLGIVSKGFQVEIEQ